MYLLYTIKVNGDIYERKIKSYMNYLKFSFVNDNYDYIEHIYELKEEDEENE